MDNEKIDVSIVLACYNAGAYAAESVRQIEEVLDATIFSYELIFVDDKSSDNTVEVIGRLIKGKDNRSLHCHTENLGRGKAVSDGFEKARGVIVGFIDLDLDNPARYIFPMITTIKNGKADVCTAQRIYKWRLNPYFVIRFLASKVYAFMSRNWLQTGLKDSETGCKFFKKEKILPILGKMQSAGWFWDTEIMTRAYYAGLKIIEMPTIFIRGTSISTVSLVPETLKYLYSLIRFRKTNKMLRKAWRERQRDFDLKEIR